MRVCRAGLEACPSAVDHDLDPLRAGLAAERVEPPLHRRRVARSRSPSPAARRSWIACIAAIAVPAVLPVEVLRRHLRLRRASTSSLKLSPASSSWNSTTPDRDHRNDHDHREEQPQPAAEGGLEQGHVRDCERQSSRRPATSAPGGYNAPLDGRSPIPAVRIGAIAQLGECLDRTQEVAGSSPASSIGPWTAL